MGYASFRRRDRGQDGCYRDHILARVASHMARDIKKYLFALKTKFINVPV